MTKYKLRAESSTDVMNFLDVIYLKLISFSMMRIDHNFPNDVVLEFETELNLKEIISYLRDIEDSHVMYQTVKPIMEYTGERDYEM